MTSETGRRRIRYGVFVSGHGWGHATRAAALTAVLLKAGHKVCIVTNASKQPFSSVLAPSSSSLSSSSTLKTTKKDDKNYATFRKANVDAGIIQPKAYDVDRQATFDCLKEFMLIRNERLKEEIEWLKEEKIEVVLSDATFLGCAAAAGAGIPAILVTNFTFDSCYSYLSLPVPEGSLDEPAIPAELLQPYVDQTRADYQQASLLLRFPGAIPIPAFDLDVPWPASCWIDEARNTFTPELEKLLSRPVESIPCGKQLSESKRLRKVVDVPLLTRLPSPDVYTPEFRTNLLNSLEIPVESHNDKILLVSFGAQSIPRPRSRPPSPIPQDGNKITGEYENVNGLLKSGRIAGLLPEGWIAVVCGLKGDRNEIKKNLPINFYASDVDVYVPDVTAICDVVLGKLGYGTCSEALTTKTPFVYVPRPIFVEELGLKRMMKLRADPVELSRTDFEEGRWEYHILEAHKRGKVDKEEIKKTGFLDEKAGEFIMREIENFLLEEESRK